MQPQLKELIVPQECAKCGSNGTLELHHIVPKSFGGGDEIQNLQWLCVDCHREIHSAGKIKKASLYIPMSLWLKYKAYEYNQLLIGKPTNFNNLINELLFKHLNMGDLK
jgi:hypothetical protein